MRSELQTPIQYGSGLSVFNTVRPLFKVDEGRIILANCVGSSNHFQQPQPVKQRFISCNEQGALLGALHGIRNKIFVTSVVPADPWSFHTINFTTRCIGVQLQVIKADTKGWCYWEDDGWTMVFQNCSAAGFHWCKFEGYSFSFAAAGGAIRIQQVIIRAIFRGVDNYEYVQNPLE